MFYLVNLDTDVFTPVGDEKITPPVDGPVVSIEIDAHPNEEQQAKILLFLHTKRHGKKPPDPEVEVAPARNTAEIREHLVKYAAANGGAVLGYSEATGVSQSVVDAVMGNKPVPQKALERAVASLRNSLSVG